MATPRKHSLNKVLASFLTRLTEEDIAAIESGHARIVLENAPAPAKSTMRNTTLDADAVQLALGDAQTREQAERILREMAPLRSDLRAVAIKLDLPTPKSDTLDRVRDRIVEATVGYKLRSDAIRSIDRKQ